MMEKIDFELEVLSPVHIGSGEKITNWEYIIEGGYLKVYPYEHLISYLHKKNPKYLEVLRNSMRDKDFSLLKLKQTNINIGEPLYELKLALPLRTREVELFIKSLGKPYIPGSELKGALRTAYIGGLLLENGDLRNQVERKLIGELKKGGNIRELLANVGSKKRGNFEEILLYPKLENEVKQDAKYDLFRAISFPDLFFDIDNLRVEVPKIVGSNRPLNAYACEALKKGTRIKGSLMINMSHINKMVELENLTYPHMNLSWERLKELSNKFYSRVIELEMEFFNNMQKEDTVNHLKKILDRLNNGILLRIGKHQGYLSTTIMSVFKESNDFKEPNERLFEKVYLGSFNRVRNEKPKTRRLSSDDSTFGWVLLVK